MHYFSLERGSGPMSAPGYVGGYAITSYYGNRPNPFTGRASHHGGMDLGAITGTKIVADESGLLVQGWDGTGGGRWSTLYADSGRRHGYGHASLYVGAPDPLLGGRRHVQAGEVIALVGSTGASTGSHLHKAEASSHGAPTWDIDPFDSLTEAAVNGWFIGSAPPTSSVTPPSEDPDMPDQFQFPTKIDPVSGKPTPDSDATYFLIPWPFSPTGFAWQYMPGPVTQAQAVDARTVSSRIRPLARGVDSNDKMFADHPVINGPHQRWTWTGSPPAA